MNSLDWWSQNLNLTTEDKETLLSYRPDTDLVHTQNFTNLSQTFFNKLLNSNISTDTYILELDTCATTMIKKLFDQYVDKDTLVISTNCEHFKVAEILNTINNKLILNHYSDIRGYNFNRVEEALTHYKKVFVYIIGTQLSTGEITPQLYLDKLKKMLDNSNCDYKFVLDDVHGMIMVPRDYTMFDYIVGTAHVLLENYDMGILISRKENYLNIGYQYDLWLSKYLAMIDTLMKYNNSIQSFKSVMGEYCQKYLSISNRISLLTYTAPQMFTLQFLDFGFQENMKQIFKEYPIAIEGIGQYNSYVRFRAIQFMNNVDRLKEGLDKLFKLVRLLANE